jgi:outer membrane protein OmpA-like peptidoglycan-associated protein
VFVDRWFKLLVWIGLFLLTPTHTQAEDVRTTPMDAVRWRYSGDAFTCRLKLHINSIGHALIVRAAGQPLMFRLDFPLMFRPVESVDVVLTDPPWTSVSKRQKKVSCDVGQGYAQCLKEVESFFEGLERGGWVNFHLRTNASDAAIKVSLPSIRFRAASEPFRQCVDRLSPLAFEQVRDVTFSFKTGQRILDNDQRALIAKIARYIELDPSVNKVLVDGYTDNVGSVAANLQLARARADEATSLLQEYGVSAQLIEQRSHGDRYPVASNTTERGRRLNRMVIVRVIR